ncbi:MAG: hypothetical protein ACOY4W_19015 [Thermodesulfobacteriota bacterium]
MQINGSSGGAALYALQQAKKTPAQIVELLKKTAQSDQKPPAAPNATDPQAADVAKMTGKGGNINVMA